MPIGVVVALGMVLAAGAAVADPIGGGGPSDTCSTCQGALLQLTYSGSKQLPDGDPLFDFFLINYHLDTSNYTGGGSFIRECRSRPTGTTWRAVASATPLSTCSTGP
jgi:hypothetical protein